MEDESKSSDADLFPKFGWEVPCGSFFQPRHQGSLRVLNQRTSKNVALQGGGGVTKKKVRARFLRRAMGAQERRTF